MLKNHASIVSALTEGMVSFITTEKRISLTVNVGGVEVKDNRIIVLAAKATK